MMSIPLRPQSERPAIHRTQVWVRRILLGALGGYWLLIFILTHLPAPDVPKAPMNDKLEHFLAYGMLGGLLYLFIWALYPSRRGIGWIVLGIGLAYGAMDEWLQIPVGRDCELNDWLADAAALLIAVAVLSAVNWAWKRRKRMQPLERPERHSS